MYLSSTSCVTLYPPDFFLVSMIFFLCLLPVNWLLALSLDLWLTLFNPLFIQAKSSCIKVCAKAEPYHK